MHILHRFGVSGFPTLKFFPKNNKAGEDYDGGRDVDDFVTFINEKCGTSRDSKGQLTTKVCAHLTMFSSRVLISNSDLPFHLIGWYCRAPRQFGEGIFECKG